MSKVFKMSVKTCIRDRCVRLFYFIIFHNSVFDYRMTENDHLITQNESGQMVVSS